MSQIPPQQPYPPQNPQQPGYPPQPGYPLQPGYPPQAGGAYTQPPQGNGWGTTSLITGIVGFCVPFVGGLLAMLFGVIGISKARKTRSGMGLSVAGLILGLVSAVFWGLFGGAILAAFGLTQANREVAKQFINDVYAGNISSAEGRTDGSITTSELQSLNSELKGYGTLTDVTTPVTSVQNDQAQLTGIISFGPNKKAFEMRQLKTGSNWKVTHFAIIEGGGRRGNGVQTAPSSAGSGDKE